MTRQQKINKLIEKSWATGRIKDDAPLVDYFSANDEYMSAEHKKELSENGIVEYCFHVKGYDSTIGVDEQDISNSSTYCEDAWENCEDEWLDYLLSL